MRTSVSQEDTDLVALDLPAAYEPEWGALAEATGETGFVEAALELLK